MKKIIPLILLAVASASFAAEEKKVCVKELDNKTKKSARPSRFTRNLKVLRFLIKNNVSRRPATD
jgi:uncharacterized Fe-S cluster-containing radical SAM superfamily protein